MRTQVPAEQAGGIVSLCFSTEQFPVTLDSSGPSTTHSAIANRPPLDLVTGTWGTVSGYLCQPLTSHFCGASAARRAVVLGASRAVPSVCTFAWGSGMGPASAAAALLTARETGRSCSRPLLRCV